MTALATAVPARTGLINLGSQGQFICGAICGSLVGFNSSGVPDAFVLPSVIAGAFLGGGIWGVLAGLARARGWVSEVILSLLLNFVAVSLLQLLVFGPLRDPEGGNAPQSIALDAAASIPTLGGSRVHIGVVIGLVIALLTYMIFRFTLWGYVSRVISANPRVARYNGLPVELYWVLAFLIGGGIAGLAGMTEIMAIHGRLRVGISSNIAWLGFLISWMSSHNPLTIILVTAFVSVMVSSIDVLQISHGLPASGVAVFFAMMLIAFLANRQHKS